MWALTRTQIIGSQSCRSRRLKRHGHPVVPSCTVAATGDWPTRWEWTRGRQETVLRCIVIHRCSPQLVNQTGRSRLVDHGKTMARPARPKTCKGVFCSCSKEFRIAGCLVRNSFSHQFNIYMYIYIFI